MRLGPALVLFTACGRVSFDPIANADSATSDVTASADAQIPVGVASSFALPAIPGAVVTVTVPTTLQVGDVMYLAMYVNNMGSTVTAPVGWQTTFSMADPNMFLAAFFERRVDPVEPASWDFPVTNSSRVAWALVAYRNVPAQPQTDVSMLTVGTGSTTDVTYMTPTIASQSEVVLLLIDDAGSGVSMSNWVPPPGMVFVANAYRVAICRGDAGPGSHIFSTTVDVPNAAQPHGALRAIGW